MASAAAYSGTEVATGIRFRVAALCALFGVAVGAAYCLIWGAAPFYGTDTKNYLEAARALAAGVDTPQPRTPGFPLFLLAAGTGRLFFLLSMGMHMAAVAMLVAVLRLAGVAYKLRVAFAVVA